MPRWAAPRRSIDIPATRGSSTTRTASSFIPTKRCAWRGRGTAPRATNGAESRSRGASRRATDREAARRALQIDDGDFVVCCFGFIDPAKLGHRLLSAWMGSALARDPRHRLVFVGQNHGGEYGRSMLRSLEEGPAGRRILITGFVDDDIYQRYLCAADAAVQLRGVSRGESRANRARLPGARTASDRQCRRLAVGVAGSTR